MDAKNNIVTPVQSSSNDLLSRSSPSLPESSISNITEDYSAITRDAVSKSPEALQYIPLPFITEEMCITAVQYSGYETENI